MLLLLDSMRVELLEKNAQKLLLCEHYLQLLVAQLLLSDFKAKFTQIVEDATSLVLAEIIDHLLEPLQLLVLLSLSLSLTIHLLGLCVYERHQVLTFLYKRQILEDKLQQLDCLAGFNALEPP